MEELFFLAKLLGNVRQAKWTPTRRKLAPRRKMPEVVSHSKKEFGIKRLFCMVYLLGQSTELDTPSANSQSKHWPTLFCCDHGCQHYHHDYEHTFRICFHGFQTVKSLICVYPKICDAFANCWSLLIVIFSRTWVHFLLLCEMFGFWFDLLFHQYNCKFEFLCFLNEKIQVCGTGFSWLLMKTFLFVFGRRAIFVDFVFPIVW